MKDSNEGTNGLTPAAIEALKQQHGNRLLMVDAPDGTKWVTQRPPKTIWAMFMNDLSNGKERSVCFERLVLDCVVYPDRAAVVSVLADFPAYATALSNELSEQAGQNHKLNAKKL